MSALEQEIIEKFSQLDHAAQKRVLSIIEQQKLNPPFAYEAWRTEIESLRQHIHPKGIDVVGTLRDLRDGEDE